MPILQYRNFDLRLRRDSQRSKKRYVVEADGAEHTFVYPFNRDREENIGLRAGAAFSRTTRAATDAGQYEWAKEVGGSLYRCLLAGDISIRWERALALAERQGVGVRLRIRCGNAPELLRLPWEYVWDEELRIHLATSERTPVIRCLDVGRSLIPRGPITSQLRVLVVIAAPRDFDPLESVKELGRVRNGYFDVTVVRGRSGKSTLTQVLDAISAAGKRPFHIFHFIGHSQFNRSSGQGELLFEDDQGKPDPLDATRLGGIFRDHPDFRLAVLNSCEGGLASISDKFSGVAQGLVLQGVPAAIGMQYAIPDDTAVKFATVFYEKLGSGRPMEASLAEARNYIRASDGMEWGIPVVYMHPDCKRLFSIPARSVAPPFLPAQTAATPAPAAELTMPVVGPVEPDSPMRISRPDEPRLAQFMSTRAVAVIVSAPGQFGRTTLLRFLAEKAKQAGKIPLWIDFGVLAPAAFSNPTLFFKELARLFAKGLSRTDPTARIEQLWAATSYFDGNVARCADFFQESLAAAQRPAVCLLLDSVDRLLGTAVKADFCRFARIWENDRRDETIAWSRMDMLLATSEEPWSLDLRNFYEAQLPPFSEEETLSLSKQYGDRLSRGQLQALHELVNGHPRLTHVSLSAARSMRLPAKARFSAATEPLASELSAMHGLLQRCEREHGIPLTVALQEIPAAKKVSDERAFYQLRVFGVVGRSRLPVDFTCPLYRDFFKS